MRIQDIAPVRLSFLGIAAAAALLGGCSSLQSSDNILGILTPYRIEVVQGNVVTREQVEQVKAGQTRAQVREILGSPLLTDVFHENRWDYVFSIRRQGTEPQQRRVVALFDGDILKSIESASELPSEREFVNSIDTFKTKRNAPPLQLTEAQIAALPKPPAPAATPAPEPEGPQRTYPPLEAAR